ncbi:MAG: excinuclease ABC subunit UvrA [Anaerolineae bacterium]|nr:excinuclease ABC subunit UvrA [Anaerolineae bacterium]
MPPVIAIRGARLHNLQGLDVDIPKNQLVVLTGLSGSGKSTLAFDILYLEGARQYLEAVNVLIFGLARPPLESITGLAATISLNQQTSTNHSPRSTVGTTTDAYTYVRILFARLGRRPCPHCGGDVPPSFGLPGDEWDDDAGLSTDPDAAPTFPCPHCGRPVPELGMAAFSFNKPEGACPTCTGLGVVHTANLARLADAERSLAGGAVAGWAGPQLAYYGDSLLAAARHYGLALTLDTPIRDYSPAARDLFYFGVDSPWFRRHFPDKEPPATVRGGRFEGLATATLRRYGEHAGDEDYAARMAGQVVEGVCPDCHGQRLRPESRAVTIAGQTIMAVAAMSLAALAAWLRDLLAALSADEHRIAAPLLEDLNARLGRLLEVGVGYLTMARASATLSAGEAQRLRLASLVGSGLTGMLYIFDEPTVGLHPRDTERLLRVLRRLRDLGNTVLVVEHDLDVIRAADTVIDMGPGAGKHGGRVVAVGAPAEVAAHPTSLTGAYLAGRAAVAPPPRRPPAERALTIIGARAHNLRDITVRLPLGRLVAITGVSGAGKSSLVFDILDRAGRARFYGATDAPGEHDAIEGWEAIGKLVTIGQEPIGRRPRSNAATYAEVFTPIRELFAAQPEAKQRGFTARRFSFNVPGGRCERCEGAGVLPVTMHLLPPVEVRCPVCHGRRYDAATLAVTYGGHDIAAVLEMTVEEALALFAGVPAVAARLAVMADVGLGYLPLGQPATTLSGGEAQRVKLARELGRRGGGPALYLLDEPTTGLHPADTARLLTVLNRLVDAGHSVVVVEHNLDVIRAADWVIDLGPEGGAAGGDLIAAGTPEDVAAAPRSLTGAFLRPLLP